MRGVVEDAEGRPVERAQVDVRRIGVPGAVREVLRTDAAGAFRIDGIPEGSYAVTVNKEGFGTVQIFSMRVSASAASRLRVQLQPAGEVQPPPPPPPPPVARAKGAAEVHGNLTPPPMPKQIAVGGGVQRMRLVTKVDPVYPAEVKAAGIEGVVILEVVIGKDGAVQTVERINRLVDNRLADAAIEAVKQWKYQPTLLNGEPVEVKTQVDVNFTLAEKSAAAGPGPAQVGVFRIGGDVSAPMPIFKVEPEYSEEARAEGFQGTVLLAAVIDEEGTPTQIRIVRALGKGLDEKAMEALAKWKFRPGMKDGRPVAVIANVEMNFRLLKPPPQ